MNDFIIKNMIVNLIGYVLSSSGIEANEKKHIIDTLNIISKKVEEE